MPAVVDVGVVVLVEVDVEEDVMEDSAVTMVEVVTTGDGNEIFLRDK